MADQIFYVNSCSFQDLEISSSMRVGSGVIVDFTQASEVTGTFVGEGSNLTQISASYIVAGSNTTSSQAISASWAPVPTSASFSSQSISSSWANTSSVALFALTAPANVFAGLTSIPTFVDNTSSFEFYVGSATVNLYSNVAGTGFVSSYTLLPITFSVPTSATASFIYASTNGVTASYGITSNFNDITMTNIVPVATVYRADEDIHWMASVDEGLALANKIELRLLETQKFAWESGFTLMDTGSNQYYITAGQVWFGATQISQDYFDSRLTQSVDLPIEYYETHWAIHSASLWTIPTESSGRYNNSYYDDGTNLVPLTNGYYCVNYFYRILGDNTLDHDAFIVMGNNEYADVASAENDKVPGDIPTVLTDVGILVGRMIILSGSITASKVESAFTTQFGSSGATTLQHNSLIGLQGGQGGEYYHMTFADYTGTGTGISVRQDGATINQSTITATGSLQGTASYSHNSSFSISSSFASQSISSSWVPDLYPQTEQLSASWSSASFVATSASFASRSISASFVPNLYPQTEQVSASWASASFVATSASFASQSISSSWVPNLYPQTEQISSSWSSASFVATSASFASRSISASYAPFTQTEQVSASWSSASFVATSASFASMSISASYAPSTQTEQVSASWASASFFATSASFSSQSISSSWALSASWAPGSVGTSESSSWSSASFVATSASFASESISASWAPQQQDITVNSITASYISASGGMVAPEPVMASDVATKQYVDNLTSFGIQYYFRSASADVTDYRWMYDINTPFSSSIDIVVNNVSASQIFVTFISPEIGVTTIQQGSLDVRYRLYRVGGATANTVRPLLYIRSGSVETFIESGSFSTITTTTSDVFDSSIPLTASLDTNLTDRLVVKFLCINGNNTPNFHFTVEGSTAAGITIPLSSANFVLKTGDVMVGDLTAPGFTGSLFGTATSASWAPPIPSDYSISSSWASQSFWATSASFASNSISASYAPPTPSDVSISSSWASQSFWATSASFASKSFSSSFADLVNISSSGANINYHLMFVLNSGSQTPMMDLQDSFNYNPSTNTLIATNFAGTASVATTSSFATRAITADTASSATLAGLLFSKGVTFFDPAGISGTSSLSQSVIAWRAPFVCTASAIYGWKSGGALTTTASIQIKRNSTLPLMTGSLFVTQSGAWVSKGAAALQNANFAIGDYMEIYLHTASYYVTQVGVQIDLVRG